MSDEVSAMLLPVPLLCSGHARKYYANDIGECRNCRDATTSREFILCAKCSRTYGLCCVCRQPADKPPPKPRR